MNVEELRQLSQELTRKLEEEKAERDACVLGEDESRMNAEIADIEMEIAKVNQLISKNTVKGIRFIRKTLYGINERTF